MPSDVEDEIMEQIWTDLDDAIDEPGMSELLEAYEEYSKARRSLWDNDARKTLSTSI